MDIFKRLHRQFSLFSYELIPYISITPAEQAWILNTRNHPEVRRWMYHSDPITPDQHTRFLSTLPANANRADWIVQTQKSRPIASLSLQMIDQDASSCLFAIYSDPDNPVPGIGRILDKIAIHLAFSVLELNILRLEVISDNQKVINLHRKIGFSETGILEKNLNDGRIIRAVQFEMTRDYVRTHYTL